MQKLSFKPIELSDKVWVHECVRKNGFRGCEYAFATAYMWSPIFDIRIAAYKGFCLYQTPHGFWFPSGEGDILEMIAALRDYSLRERGKPLCFTNVDSSTLEMLRELFGEQQSEISTNRDYYDYVYDYKALSTLRGRKLHGKRNHLHRFRENAYGFEPITPDSIEEIAAMHNKWCDMKGVYSDPAKLREAGAVIRGLDAFFELGLTGGAIRTGGEIVAYTFASEIGNRENDTLAVHVEKAHTELQGCYTAICNDFMNSSQIAAKGYKYINREEDMGAENLRKSKLSYRPAFLLEKYKINFK